MATVIKASVFAQKLKNIAANYKTLYVMGCFGAPMTAANKKRYCDNHDYNRQASRQRMINAASEDTFGFDCVCLLKGVMWGWSGDKNAAYGGAKYASNGVPDIGADSMINVCSGISTDFSNIQVGEAVWVKGHIGLYVGDGLAVECTPAWKNKVQITAVGNIGTKSGYNTRKWTKHGKLPYVEYDVKADTVTEPVKPTTPDMKFKVGDIVQFNGNTHYTNANAASGKPCKSGEAKVTAVYNGKHPYHLIATSGGGSNVYGWVNAADIAAKTTAEKPKPSAEYTVGSDNEHTCYNFFTQVMSLNRAAACGILANINYESGFKPTALGDSGTSYGICQWHNTRWTRLKDWCAKNGKDDTTLDGQLWFLKYELENYYKTVLSTLKGVADSSQGAYDAGYCWCVKFEIPANKEAAGAKRGEYAKTLYAKYTGGTTKPSQEQSKKVDYAQKFDKAVAGRYKVTASSGLHIRAGASTAKSSLGVLKNGTMVSNYGYYSIAADGTKWLYVKTADGIVGFCSSKYLAKC